MNKHVILPLLALLLSGCASQADIDRLNANVRTLELKVTQLQQNVDKMKPEAQQARSDAERANHRLDQRGYIELIRAVSDL